MQWSPNLTNMNVFEIVWGQTMQKLTAQPSSTIPDLKQRAFSYWNEITLQYLCQVYFIIPCTIQTMVEVHRYPSRF